MIARMDTKVRNMTEGDPLKLIIFFSLPLMLGNMFQQIYTVTDALIVSRSLGVNALAALGTCDWYNWMMLSIVQAVTQGFAVIPAMDFGAEDYEHLNKSTAYTVKLSIITAVLLTAFALFSIKPMLGLLHAPEAVRPAAEEYLRVIFSGIPAVMLLNLTSSILRAFGNSRTPLTGMVISSLMNIILDLIFVRVFQWGIGGAASATVLSQLAAGLFCMYEITKLPFLKIRKEDFFREKGLTMRLLKLCIPMALMNLLISVGGMVVQSVVNTFDVAHIAGYTATNKLYGALEMAAVAYGYAMVTYIGQNAGAKKYERIRKGIRASLTVSVITGAVIGILMIIFGKEITGAFMSGEGAETIEAGKTAYDFLVLMSSFLPVLYVLHTVRSSLQGFGNTVMPMVSGIAEFITRISMALFAAAVLGWNAVTWAEIAAWFAADIILFTALYAEMKKIRGLS